MAPPKEALCVSTTKPTTSLTPGGGGGAITLICPQTGSILSSLRASSNDNSNSSKSLLGMSSVSMFPQAFGSLMMAYGGTLSRKDDTYGMLLTVRSVSSPPFLHWKCRLPEAQLSAGLLVSPCGHYIVGGSQTGNLFVWTSIGGNLLHSIKAHYRPVTTMVWTSDSSYLITGGADGMVHVFSALDLVEAEEGHNAAATTISPVRTWSAHHLPVTALQVLDGDRIVSASEDGQVVVMELTSETTLCTMKLSHGIQSLAHHDGRLYAGSVQGTIHVLDLDVYAAHRTLQLGVTVKRRKIEGVVADKVLHLDNGMNSDYYKSELRGHETCVTALAIWIQSDDNMAFLVSGDNRGALRVWDLEARGCVKVLHPWSHSVRATDESASSSNNGAAGVMAAHPIASITIISRGETTTSSSSVTSTSAAFTTTMKEQKANSIVNLITPLKRFANETSKSEARGPSSVPVPFLRPKPTMETLVADLPSYLSSAPDVYVVKPDRDMSKLQEELTRSKERIRQLEEEKEALLHATTQEAQ